MINFSHEIEMAQAARAGGNEGKARVCARRAVGWVIREYYFREGILVESGSAYDYLRSLQQSEKISPEAKKITGNFLTRISPEGELPIDADLISEAYWLKDYLLGNAD